ncbi:MAG: M10 family metallopeptidase C-terminal domain-containing protein, partial [Caulobacteraceae bacterium]
MDSAALAEAADLDIPFNAATPAPVYGGGSPHTGAVPLTLLQITRGLQVDYWWDAGQFTFSIPGVGGAWPTYASDEEPFTGFAGLSAAQAQRFRMALASWDMLIAPNFTETDDATSPGNIRVAFSTYSDLSDFWGYAYFPNFHGGSGPAYAGDIWVNARHKTSDLFDGGYDLNALIHEIGHALGLKHSFEAPAIPAPYDNTRYTVMSYTDQDDYASVSFLRTANGGLASALTEVYSTTPMVLDVAAIQARYGADPTTAAGDNVYTFAGDQPFLFTIYDAGGNDTIDVSRMAHGSVVDLTPGSYSSIGYYSVAAQKADAVDKYGPYYTSFIANTFDFSAYAWADNLGLAFSTTIENAIGGANDDTFIGNLANNRLTGGAGNDIFTGGGGDDVIDGGAGFDIAIYSGASSDYSWTQGATSWTVRDLRNGALDGVDTLAGVEFLRFSDRSVGLGSGPLAGTAGADTLTAGALADEIYGLDGDDRLTGNGGNDFLDGGAGSDTAYYASSAKDHAWWSNPDGTWTVKDLRVGAPDGTDTLRDIEAIQFLDKTVKLRGLTTTETIAAVFENVMMYTPTSAADTSFIAKIATDVVTNGEPWWAVVAEIVERASASTAVASIAYE